MKERRWHAAVCMIIASVGLFLAVTAKDHLALSIAMFSFRCDRTVWLLARFLVFANKFFVRTTAAASIGLINQWETSVALLDRMLLAI